MRDDEAVPTAGGGEERREGPREARPTLEATGWRLVAGVDADGRMAPVSAAVRPTARFESGQVSGSGGCNRYSGSYAESGGRLSFGPLASTMRACEPDRMATEAAFLGALARVVSWTVRGDGALELGDAAGRTLLRFAAEPEPTLTGVEWHATGVNNGRGGVASPVAGTTITAAFGEDGRLSGSGGCNRYTASWKVAGAALDIGPVGSTRMLCPDEGVGEQELAYFAALGRATRVDFVDHDLHLRDDAGALQVSFRSSARTGDDAGG